MSDDFVPENLSPRKPREVLPIDRQAIRPGPPFGLAALITAGTVLVGVGIYVAIEMRQVNRQQEADHKISRSIDQVNANIRAIKSSPTESERRDAIRRDSEESVRRMLAGESAEDIQRDLRQRRRERERQAK